MRMLWRQPRFSAVAIVTLALGIGATTAIYSVVHGVLLKPLPFPDPDRLVALYHVTPASQKDFQGAATYFTYRDHGRVFDDIGLWQAGNVAATRNGEPEQVRVLRVTDGTLSLLGVRPELGRLIATDDDVPGAPLVAVLTHGYWQQAFGASSDAVGQSLVLNGQPCEIVGVLPASFRFLDADPQLILPMRLDRATTRTLPFATNGVARLKRDVTLAQANDDIARMIPLIVTEFPLMPGVTQAMWNAVGLAPNVRPLSEAVIGDVSRPLWMLLGTAAIVLLMSWTNVANLLLVRAESRQQELAVRWAMGAGRGRVAVALLSESLALGLAGGALGVVFARGGIALLRRLAPVALPRLDEIGLDAEVLLVTLGISVATGLLFGFVPVLRSRAFSGEALKESGRASTDTPGRHRMRNALVVGQIALAFVLLTSAGLMARTFMTMRQVQPGFARPAEVETFQLSLPRALIPDEKQVVPALEQIAARLQRIAGVSAVGLGVITMDGRAGKGPIFVEGAVAPSLPPIRSMWTVGPGYFETMGTAVVAGRTLTWADIHQLRPLAVISENLALEYWKTPGEAVGHRIRSLADEPWQEIVGVVGNVRADGLNHPSPALVYFPLASAGAVTRNTTYVVRSARAGTPGLLRELQQAARSACQRSDARRHSLRFDGVRIVRHGHADDCVEYCPAAGARRRVQRGRACRGGEDHRDRHPPGSRRADRRRAPSVPAPRTRPHVRGNRRRPRRGHVDDAADVGAALRGRAGGSRDICRGVGGSRGSDPAGDLCSGSPRIPRTADRRLAVASLAAGNSHGGSRRCAERASSHSSASSVQGPPTPSTRVT